MLKLIRWLLNLKGKQISVTVPLESGYSVENERAANAAKLKQICDITVKNPKYVSIKVNGEWKTFCNEGTEDICKQLKNLTFPLIKDGAIMRPMMANELFDYLVQQSTIKEGVQNDWVADIGARAHLHASRGGLAIAIKKHPVHGHVTVIYPANAMYESGSWAKLVPYACNIGAVPPHQNDVVPISQAFAVLEGEPLYFLFKPDSI